MKKLGIFAIFVLCVFLTAIVLKTEGPYQVGEKWVYHHEGPKLERWEFFWELDSFEGERTREVISAERSWKIWLIKAWLKKSLMIDEGGGDQNKRSWINWIKTNWLTKNWVIKERYGDPRDVIEVRHFIDKNNRIDKSLTISPRGFITKRNDPAYPFDRAGLAIGEEKEFKGQQTTNPFYAVYPYTVKFKRLKDQTMEVPAGKFTDCRHYKISVSYTSAGEYVDYRKTSISEDIDMWCHPDVNGIVKNITRSGPFEYMAEIRDGYTATSVLKSYTSGK
jgi:hypothetical protein